MSGFRFTSSPQDGYWPYPWAEHPQDDEFGVAGEAWPGFPVADGYSVPISPTAWPGGYQLSVPTQVVPGQPLAALQYEDPGVYRHPGIALTSSFGGVYGVDATRAATPFENITLHDTGGNKTLDWYVDYGHRPDEGRGGTFGYHFYIGPDGTIVQGAPMDVRTNGATGYGVFRNANTIHVSMVGTAATNTPEQIAAATALVNALANDYGISPERIVGHGNIQPDREERSNPAIWEVLERVDATDGNILRPGNGMTPYPPDSRVLLAQTVLDSYFAEEGGLDADGLFGPSMLDAVQIFQQENNLPLTGFIDEATQALMVDYLRRYHPAVLPELFR